MRNSALEAILVVASLGRKMPGLMVRASTCIYETSAVIYERIGRGNSGPICGIGISIIF
jgi:hypothetical protein